MRNHKPVKTVRHGSENRLVASYCVLCRNVASSRSCVCTSFIFPFPAEAAHAGEDTGVCVFPYECEKKASQCYTCIFKTSWRGEEIHSLFSDMSSVWRVEVSKVRSSPINSSAWWKNDYKPPPPSLKNRKHVGTNMKNWFYFQGALGDELQSSLIIYHLAIVIISLIHGILF